MNIGTDSGDRLPSGDEDSLPTQFERPSNAESKRQNGDADTESDSDDSDASDSDDSDDSDSDNSGGGGGGGRFGRAFFDRTRTPPWFKTRKNNFVQLLYQYIFYDERDRRAHSTPLSFDFLIECDRTSSAIEDIGALIAPIEVENGTNDVPTERALKRDNGYYYVRLTDKCFWLALQEVQRHLRKDFDVKYFTLPFSMETPADDKINLEQANWAGSEHVEAVQLFVRTVNKMHQVKLLEREANASGTEATRGYQRKATAVAFMETARKNLWVLNTQFDYAKNLGGFHRKSARRKNALALVSSLATAANMKGGAETVRPKTAKERRWANPKRPRKKRKGDLTKAPTELSSNNT